METRVLITSRSFAQVSDKPIQLLRDNDIQFDMKEKPGLFREEDFLEVIDRYDALIIGADVLTAECFRKASKLRLVCKHGVGVDNIDLRAAREAGVIVTNVVGVNSDAVADLTFGLILDVARRISYAASRVKNGKWEKVIGSDVHNRKLGIIGFGAIGMRVAKRALGFDMEVLVNDPFVKDCPHEFGSVKMKSFEEVIGSVDFLTFHVPLNKETTNLLDESQLAMMKRGAVVINTSRGGIINEAALYKYLSNGHLGGAGLDVLQNETLDGNPLLLLDNVTIVPHIASYAKEAVTAVDMVCARNIVKFIRGDKLDSVVV